MFKKISYFFLKNKISHKVKFVALLFIGVCFYQSIFLSQIAYGQKLPEHTNFDPVKVKKFSQSKRWNRLLYYGKSGVSEIDSPDFFLTANGKSDSLHELTETLLQMFHQDPQTINDEHAICKFPARFYFLDKEFEANEFHKIKHCPKFLDFVNRSSGQSISLVFSAYSLNSPSSAFGHTFLKINKHEKQGFDLLNYGINYAATTTGAHPIFYAAQGLLGSYKGEFTAIPFYYKLREYNDFESRDLWEYELNLGYEDVQAMTMHFWELGRGWSWYYFLGKNCSYWAIKALQAVVIDLDFEQELRRALVLPVETIKALYDNKDLVKQVYYRPSLHKQLKKSLKDLSKKEQRTVKAISEQAFLQQIQDQKQLQNLSLKTLDSALLFYDYKYAKNYLHEEKQTLANKQPLLIARSKMSNTDMPKPESIKPSSPEMIHPPQRVSLGYQTSKAFDSLKFGYKMGFHELIDSNHGMEAPLAMNYLDVNLHFYKTEVADDWKFDLDRIDLLRIETLATTSYIERKLSWRLKLSISEDLWVRSPTQKVGHFQYDSGLTFAFDENQTALFYILLSNNIESSARFKNKFRLSMAPLLGFKVHWNPNWATLVELKHQWFWDTDSFQRQWAFDLQTQYYIPRLQSAIYLKGLVFEARHSAMAYDDAQIEVGVRKFY